MHPAKASDVIERPPCSVSWAYTTIETLLDNLVESRAVNESKSGKQKEMEVEGIQAICI
jgi:predicted transcriptional regulator